MFGVATRSAKVGGWVVRNSKHSGEAQLLGSMGEENGDGGQYEGRKEGQVREGGDAGAAAGGRKGQGGAGGRRECRSRERPLISDQSSGALERLLAVGGDSLLNKELELFASCPELSIMLQVGVDFFCLIFAE